MTDEIKVGDVVRLKSGGPNMTVTEIGPTQFSDDLSVWCEWFDDKNKPQNGTFSLVAVEIASAPQPVATKRRVPKIIKH